MTFVSSNWKICRFALAALVAVASAPADGPMLNLSSPNTSPPSTMATTMKPRVTRRFMCGSQLAASPPHGSARREHGQWQEQEARELEQVDLRTRQQHCPRHRLRGTDVD